MIDSLPIILLVVLLFCLIVAGIAYRCSDSFVDQHSKFTEAASRLRRPLASAEAASRLPFRPDHPSWYKDIPETHPEVLELIRQTEEQVRETPTFTEKGYNKMRMPAEIYKYLLEHVKSTDRTKEDSNNIFRRTSSGPPPYLIQIQPEKKQWIFDTLKPILEEWSGLKGMVGTSAYGPREYRRGSSLRMHVDTGNTHIISAILHIDRENMDKDWPLVIINREGKRENIYMEPGDMVLYESASLPHSREQPLEGDYYTNMFIHFAPPTFEKMKEEFKASKR